MPEPSLRRGRRTLQTPLLIGGGVYIVGGLLTLLVNPEKPLESV